MVFLLLATLASTSSSFYLGFNVFNVSLKPGVIANGVSSEIVLALLIAGEIYREIDKRLVVTSLLDGNHSRASLHYIGHAADLRTRNLSDDEVAFVVKELRSRLTSEFDVVEESTHIHLEFQPKK